MLYSFQMQENWTVSTQTEGFHILHANSKEWTSTHRYVQAIFTLLEIQQLGRSQKSSI